MKLKMSENEKASKDRPHRRAVRVAVVAVAVAVRAVHVGREVALEGVGVGGGGFVLGVCESIGMSDVEAVDEVVVLVVVI